MDWQRDLVGLLAGFVLAAVTTPVGVSGAVFLLPFQLSVLHVPSPRITPTNLLYNVISGPGGLARFRRRGQFDRALARQLVAGSVPGVVLGAVIRVYVGIATGMGGLAGGWLGAPLQPRIPERILRTGLGIVALALDAMYLVQQLG